MKLLSTLATALGLSSFIPQIPFGYSRGTPSRRLRIGSKHIRPTNDMRRSILGLTSFCPQSDKRDDLPRGYPGAKLARKAAQGKLGIRH